MQFLRELQVGPIRRSLFAVAAGGAALLSIFSAGCESSVDVEDGGAGGGVACCEMDPQCPEGTLEVSECLTSECSSVEACCTEKLCEPAGTCTAVPTCELYETEVATCEGSTAPECRSLTECGSTIYCAAEDPCGAVPQCDEGDEQQNGECPQDAACYQVEICGAVVTCMDNGQTHGCPDTAPVQSEPCAVQGVVCSYPLESDPSCTENWTCTDEVAPPGGTPGGSGAPDISITWQPLGIVCVDGEAP